MRPYNYKFKLYKMNNVYTANTSILKYTFNFRNYLI